MPWNTRQSVPAHRFTLTSPCAHTVGGATIATRHTLLAATIRGHINQLNTLRRWHQTQATRLTIEAAWQRELNAARLPTPASQPPTATTQNTGATQ